MYLKKNILLRLIILLGFILMPTIYKTQVGINTENPEINADLTLGSNNKGFLTNKVSLLKPDDPSPLSNLDIMEGTLIFNTNPNTLLKKGLYIWDGTNWNTIIYNNDGLQQDFINLVNNKTNDNTSTTQTYDQKNVVLLNSIDQEIVPLGTIVQAPKDGKFYISTVIYSKITIGPISDFTAVSTFYTIQITDLTDGTPPTNFYSGSSNVAASISIPGGGTGSASNNPALVSSDFIYSVKENHQYQIKVFGKSDGNGNSSLQILAGTYAWRNPINSNIYQLYSTLKVDFLSNAYTQ
ncbi:hypothetical protein ETU08_05465 [Apibacter muscae]|uniref:Uncharacterized protein n=1 Tax=Apibacter muscae TaxID=2509004 RepID=A0A563DEV7_9FLAO|nr:hypothetical protein [Apibacter muscae]TWP28740.1 hypothetical protein ETU09_05340 [Apibacter muscae]TWP30008.1 hypothetical protein ETU08_05465 [Apibacter muscae]